MKVHIGHGAKPEKGFKKFNGDPEYPWTDYKSNSIEELLITFYVHRTTDLVSFMEEAYRVLKKGGKCTIVSPYWNSAIAWQHPETKRAVSEVTFMYFNKEVRDANGIEDKIECDFDVLISHQVDVEHQKKSMDAQAFAVKNFSNSCHTIVAQLKKK